MVACITDMLCMRVVICLLLVMYRCDVTILRQQCNEIAEWKRLTETQREGTI